MAAPRKYLGRDQNLGAAIRVYLLPDAIEIDEVTFVEIERTRVTTRAANGVSRLTAG